MRFQCTAWARRRSRTGNPLHLHAERSAILMMDRVGRREGGHYTHPLARSGRYAGWQAARSLDRLG